MISINEGIILKKLLELRGSEIRGHDLRTHVNEVRKERRYWFQLSIGGFYNIMNRLVDF